MKMTWKIRAYPTKRQHAMLADYLTHTRQLYNAALQERQDCYRKTGRSISNAEQSKGLTELRKDPIYAVYPRRMQRWAIDLVEVAYKGMFTRHRKGDKLGMPQFRSSAFWNTLGWDSPVQFKMRERGLYSSGALGGTLRIRPDRELPSFSQCKALKLCREGDRWFAHLTYDIPDVVEKKRPTRPVGIDVGLITAIMRSDGVPEHLDKVSPDIVAEQRRAARALSRCGRRSKRRRRVKARLRKINNHIAARRKSALQVASARLVHHFDAVAVEDLKLVSLTNMGGKNAQGRGIRKSWRDRAPGMLFDMLKWKAQREGRPYRAVDPRGTSILCSGCGAEVRKTLRDRVHSCKCGAVLDRDHNAALNVLARAGWGPGDVKLGVRGGAQASLSAGLSLKHGSFAGPRRGRISPPPFLLGTHFVGRRQGIQFIYSLQYVLG